MFLGVVGFGGVFQHGLWCFVCKLLCVVVVVCVCVFVCVIVCLCVRCLCCVCCFVCSVFECVCACVYTHVFL